MSNSIFAPPLCLQGSGTGSQVLVGDVQTSQDAALPVGADLSMHSMLSTRGGEQHGLHAQCAQLT